MSWISLKIGNLIIEAKVYLLPSKYGIFHSNVSKLHIAIGNKDIVCYDRGFAVPTWLRVIQP